jgi:hypothetical protein
VETPRTLSLGGNLELGLVRVYEPEDFGVISPVSRANQAVPKGLLFCQYIFCQCIPLLLQVAQFLAQLAKFFPLIGEKTFSAFSVVPIDLPYPILNGGLG